MQYQIIENAQIAPQVFLLDLAGDTSMVKAPGQFCQIQLHFSMKNVCFADKMIHLLYACCTRVSTSFLEIRQRNL